MKYLMFFMVMMLANVANAMDCQNLPDCASLGYSKDKDPNCTDNGYINCPFDETYKRCVNDDCEALGFTDSDKTSWCADLIECRGNSEMTLCQKPCFATTYQELKELAESGKCKVVTVRNDIEIPQDATTINVTSNTTIDGGNHTLNINSLANTSVIYLKNQSALKNLKMTCAECSQSPLINVEKNAHVSLSDLDLNTSTENYNMWTHVILGGGSGGTNINLSGNISIKSHHHRAIGFGIFKLNNAVFHVETEGIDALADSALTAENSQIYLSSTENVFVRMRVSLTNSTLEGFSRGIFLHAQGSDTGSLILKEGSSAVFTGEQSFSTTKVDISFEGTAEKTASLTISAPKLIDSGGEQTSVNVKNTNATLTINGTTYKPKQTGTTLLSEVEKSENWTQAQ